MVDSEGGTILCCLAQSGDPVKFSAIGGGRLVFDFDDSQIPEAVLLLACRDTPLALDWRPLEEGELIHRRGGKREGAGRPRSKTEQSEYHE